MKKQMHILIVLAIFFASACVPKDDGTVIVNDDPETEEYRQALVSEDDVKMEYAENGTATAALNGTERSALGLMTASAVIHTQLHLYGHLLLMREIVKHVPTGRYKNKRIWEHTEGDVFLRVTIEKSPTPRGTKFDYKFEASKGDGDLLRLLDGDVVRIETRPDAFGKQGFGFVRVYLTNLNAIDPAEHEATGTVRVAFRKVGFVRQVRVRMINIEDPTDPSAPRFGEYGYVLLRDNSGGLKWFSIGDAKGDGAPYENVAVHSVWRDDRSGIGNAFVFGGSLEVDYWSLSQCWDNRFFLGYQQLDAPDFQVKDGDIATCFDLPEELPVPDYEMELPDEDPAMPEAHEAEETE